MLQLPKHKKISEMKNNNTVLPPKSEQSQGQNGCPF